MNILFVCTGNTCRSPMAEAMLKSILEKKGIDSVSVKSAGIAAYEGEPASAQAIMVLAEEGIDLKNHRAAQINEKLLREADLILTMTENHKISVLAAAPFAWNKVYTLKEYAGMSSKDIQDPFGQSLEVYRESLREIRELLDIIVERLGFNS